MGNFFGIGLLFLLSCASRAQDTDAVTRIEYSKLTRGYQEHIVLTKDSVNINKQGNTSSSKLSAKKWTELLNSIKDVSLDEISTLKSPTKNRAFDGAMHSTIQITTQSGKSVQHMFDDENPHKKLKLLMNTIHTIVDKN